MKRYKAISCFTLGLLAFYVLPSIRADLIETHWTGAIDNHWSEAGNWTNGVPTLDHVAIFDGNSANLTIILPGTGVVPAGSLLFKGNGGRDVVLQNHESTTGTDRNWSGLPDGFNLTVESGSGSVTIDLNGGRLFANGGTYRFTNDSIAPLYLPSYQRDSGGAPVWRFDGSGDIFPGNAGESSWRTHLEPTFTGTLHIVSGNNWHGQGGVYIEGGTLLVDGVVRNRAPDFHNNGGVLTGHGRLGAPTTANNVKELSFQMNAGAIVDPGRVGEVGVLTFENHDFFLNEGSTLRLDMRSALDGEYDQLRFALTQTTGADRDLERTALPNVFLSQEGVGTQLHLNLLEGFSANLGDEFVILSDYASITGTFAALADGEELAVGDYVFRINYEESQTVLTVVPEPATVALLSGMTLLFFVVARRCLVGFKLSLK